MTCLPANLVDAYTSIEDESRLNGLHPFIVQMCGGVKGKKVLDFGCGEGRLAIRLAKAGAKEVVCIDSSELMLEKCDDNRGDVSHEIRKRLRVKRGNEECLSSYAKGFDIAICSLVLMMQPSLGAVKRIIEGLVESLNEEGELIIAVTHPCFRSSKNGFFHMELPDSFQYWDSEKRYNVVIVANGEEKSVVLSDYHWALADYFHAMERAGACLVDGLELPALLSEDKELLGDPAYLIMRIKKSACMQKKEGESCRILKERVSQVVSEFRVNAGVTHPSSAGG